MSYDDKFYDSIRGITMASAGVIVPIVLTRLASIGFKTRSVVDVGGGQGYWAAAFRDYGGVARQLCLDGDYVENPVVPFTAVNLEKPLTRFGEFGLAVCLEVAEHLTDRRARSFVEELCSMAPVILFSAAIPEQGGENHINEKPPGFWHHYFADNGFIMSGYLRPFIWDDARVASWYRQNLMLVLHSKLITDHGAPEGFFDDVPPKELIHPATGNPRLKERA